MPPLARRARFRNVWVALGMLLGGPAITAAQGHGPVFGLSTPTLGRGGWSVDVALMGRAPVGGHMGMLRPMVSYGLTEDVQLSTSVPIPIYRTDGLRPARAMTRMPATPDVEATLGWRFHRTGTGIGARFESTAYLGFGYPTDGERAGVDTAPVVTVAAVSGFASREVYLWVGALHSRPIAAAGPTQERLGNLSMYSLVVGYRPAPFRRDYPSPDWRVFLELIGERVEADQSGTADLSSTGGHRVFVAPTLLGLYGAWGIAGGPAFPLRQRPNTLQPRERIRWVVNWIVWF